MVDNKQKLTRQLRREFKYWDNQWQGTDQISMLRCGRLIFVLNTWLKCQKYRYNYRKNIPQSQVKLCEGRPMVADHADSPSGSARFIVTNHFKSNKMSPPKVKYWGGDSWEYIFSALPPYFIVGLRHCLFTDVTRYIKLYSTNHGSVAKPANKRKRMIVATIDEQW